MTKAPVQKWLSGRLALHTSRSYWRALRTLSKVKLLTAVFITFFGVGFIVDLLLLSYQPLAHGFFWPVYCGTLGVAGFMIRMQRPRLIPFLLLMTLAGLWLGVRLSFHSPAPPDARPIVRRYGFPDPVRCVGRTPPAGCARERERIQNPSEQRRCAWYAACIHAPIRQTTRRTR